MSGYFDHVRCHNCSAHVDPERIETVEGKMVCPACGEDLKLTDLFGVKASFLEEDGPRVTLDDLVPGDNGHFENPWGSPDLGNYAERNARWQYATEDEKAAYSAGIGGPPPMEGMGGRTEPASKGASDKAPGDQGVSNEQLPPGAVRARHIDPPERQETRYRDPVPTPEPAPRRQAAKPDQEEPARRRRPRFKGPSDAQPHASAGALIHTGSGDDDEFAPRPIEDEQPPGSALDTLRKMREGEAPEGDDEARRPKKKRRRY